MSFVYVKRPAGSAGPGVADPPALDAPGAILPAAESPTHVEDEVRLEQPVLWRIHRTAGEQVLPWSSLGQKVPGAEAFPGSIEAALDVATAITETFGRQRLIDTAGGRPKATAWRPTRPLCLLDLTADRALMDVSARVLAADPRSLARTWPDLDGAWSRSAATGRIVVTLWAPAADSFPQTPEFSEYLEAAPMWAIAGEIVQRYPAYRLV